MKIPDGRTLVVAWPEMVPKPNGMIGHVVRYLVRAPSDGSYEVCTVEPSEQTARMVALFPVVKSATREMTRAVAMHVRGQS